MGSTMTRRERLRRCFFLEELDRPAVFSRTGYPAGDPSYDRLKAYLAARAELKQGWGGGRFETPLPIDTHTEPYSEDFERHVEILHTPKGDLRSTALKGLKGQPGMHETYFIKTPEDAEAYLSIPLPEFKGDVSSFFAADAAMGDAGIIDVGLGHCPAGIVAVLCGSDTLAMMSVTDRDVVHRLLARRQEISLLRAKFLLGQGVGPFFSMAGEEYIVPPLHGPRDFRDFVVRYDKRIIDLVHDAGGRMHIHSHGSIKAVFQGFIDMGTDVLHPFEAPPLGDITAREAKALARGRLCLEGNIQIHRMYEAAPDEVRAETEALIADAFDDRRGLIVCPTASPYIVGQGEHCFPMYKAMVDAVVDWKG